MSWQPALCLAGIAFALLCLAVAIKPKPKNRKRGLPPPSDLCKRMPDWHAAELKSPRGYVP